MMIMMMRLTSKITRNRLPPRNTANYIFFEWFGINVFSLHTAFYSHCSSVHCWRFLTDFLSETFWISSRFFWISSSNFWKRTNPKYGDEDGSLSEREMAEGQEGQFGNVTTSRIVQQLSSVQQPTLSLGCLKQTVDERCTLQMSRLLACSWTNIILLKRRHEVVNTASG